MRLDFAFLFEQIGIVGAADECVRSKSETESKEEQGEKKRRRSVTCLCLGVCESTVERGEMKKTENTKNTKNGEG